MKKSDLYGIIGSAVFCGLVLLLLLFIYMPANKIPEEEGIIVSFGDSFDGGGRGMATNVQSPQPDPAPPTPTTTPAQPQPVRPQPSQEDVLTQDDNSLAVARQEEERKRREQEEADRKRKEEEQRRQEEQARLAEERRKAEEERKRQEAIDRANNLAGNAFSGTGEETPGSGVSSGAEQQGNPVGKGTSGGNSWSLDGRSLIGKFVTPNYSKNVEGVITVEIRVDENGTVTSASIIAPTTIISDREIRNATLEAARKTKFSSGKNAAVGTITYNFKLK